MDDWEAIKTPSPITSSIVRWMTAIIVPFSLFSPSKKKEKREKTNKQKKGEVEDGTCRECVCVCVCVGGWGGWGGGGVEVRKKGSRTKVFTAVVSPFSASTPVLHDDDDYYHYYYYY